MPFYEGLIVGLIIGIVIGIVFSALVVMHNTKERERLKREGLQDWEK